MRQKPSALMLAAFCAIASSPVLGADMFINASGLATELAAIRFAPAGMSVSNPSTLKGPSVPSSPTPSKDKYPVRGIDISTYQGVIRWDIVKSQGLSFVFIKATEGTSFADDAFLRNWKGASKAGMRKGAYHFYNFCKNGAEQAANFIKTVPRDPEALAPTIDLEISRACGIIPSRPSFRKDLSVFIEMVKAAYGKTPILYINSGIYARYFSGEKDGSPLWISSPRGEPSLPDNREWTFWQYSFSGTVKGIDGPVDLDVFNGSPEEFASFP